jgi:hypothetical protein
MAETITARVIGQGTGDTADQIAWEVKYIVSGNILLPSTFIAQVDRTLTDTEMESAIREQTADYINTLQNQFVFNASDVRGGKI